MEPPKGRISTKPRRFQQVVADLQYTVFSVIRWRMANANHLQVTALGSGFFVAKDVFLTCSHVLNSAENPHQDGDTYHLAGHFAGKFAVHEIRQTAVGRDIFLYPDCDLGLIKAGGDVNQPYVALGYEDVPVGLEIGVAGYPLPRLIQGADGKLQTAGLIFRVAKGVVTASYKTNIQASTTVLPELPVVEVNFLFVPGNSGGPVFNAETGRVLAFVHGYQVIKIGERLETVTAIPQLPPGVGNSYIGAVHAVYSVAIKLDPVRAHIEQHGATL